jgi:hypothetical protein
VLKLGVPALINSDDWPEDRPFIVLAPAIPPKRQMGVSSPPDPLANIDDGSIAMPRFRSWSRDAAVEPRSGALEIARSEGSTWGPRVSRPGSSVANAVGEIRWSYARD